MAQIDRQQLGEMLSAYLDGQLDEKETRRIERVLADDAEARVLLGELRATVAVIGSLPRHPAPDSIQDDLRLLLERNELLGEPTQSPTARDRRGPSAGRWLSMAAMVGLVTVAGAYFLRDWDAIPVDGPATQLVDARRVKDLDESVAEKADVNRPCPGDRLAVRDSRTDVGRTILTDKVENAAPAVPPSRGRASEAALADAWSNAMASSNRLEQKTASRGGLRSLQRHRFDDEPIHLKVVVSNDSDRETAMSALIQRLRSRQVREATTSPYSGITSAPAGVFFRGRRGQNFQAEGSDQLIVSLPTDELEGLLGDVHRAAEKGDISLAAGPVTVRGFDETRLALRRAEQFLPDRTSGPPGELLADARTGATEELEQPNLLDGLSRAVGVPPGVSSAEREIESQASRSRGTSAKDAARSAGEKEMARGGRSSRQGPSAETTDRAEESAETGPSPAASVPAAAEPGSPATIEAKTEHARSSPMKEPTSLVERRARELEGMFRRGHNAVGGEAVSPEQRRVTLVVEFAVAKGVNGANHAQ